LSAPARGYDPALQARLDRCDREIEEIRNRPDVLAGKCPAWLVALGIMDWELEKRLILREAGIGEK
jgi:hypothetical protein